MAEFTKQYIAPLRQAALDDVSATEWRGIHLYQLFLLHAHCNTYSVLRAS